MKNIKFKLIGLALIIAGLVIIYFTTNSLPLVIAVAVGIIGLLVTILILKNKNKNKFVKVRVDIVIDGDTAMVKHENVYKHHKIRFIGLNCPEDTTEHEPFGKQATDFAKKHLHKKYVYLERDVDDKDKHGRELRYIWLDKPKRINEKEVADKLFNAILLKEGYARIFSFEPNIKYHDYFVKFEKEAKENKKGMWALKAYEKLRTQSK